jgi:hypothetical protein
LRAFGCEKASSSSMPSSQVVEMVPVLAMSTSVRAQSAEEGRRESASAVSAASAAASATADVRVEAMLRDGATTATRAEVDAAAAVLFFVEEERGAADAVAVTDTAAQHMAAMVVVAGGGGVLTHSKEEDSRRYVLCGARVGTSILEEKKEKGR